MQQTDDPETPGVGGDRRDFIRSLAALVAAAGVGLELTDRGEASQAVPPTGPKAPKENLVGIQMGPHTMLDEGIDRSPRSHPGHGRDQHALHLQPRLRRRPAQTAALARDRSRRRRRMDQRTPQPAARLGQAARPVLQGHDAAASEGGLELRLRQTAICSPRSSSRPASAASRSTRASSRPGRAAIENFSKVVTVNVYGKPTQTGCWNHPEYIGFWRATVEDLFRSYDLDGFQWGAERAEPADQRDPERQRHERDLLLRVLPRPRQGGRHRRRARAQGLRGVPAATCRGCAPASRSRPTA